MKAMLSGLGLVGLDGGVIVRRLFVVYSLESMRAIVSLLANRFPTHQFAPTVQCMPARIETLDFA